MGAETEQVTTPRVVIENCTQTKALQPNKETSRLQEKGRTQVQVSFIHNGIMTSYPTMSDNRLCQTVSSKQEMSL